MIQVAFSAIFVDSPLNFHYDLKSDELPSPLMLISSDRSSGTIYKSNTDALNPEVIAVALASDSLKDLS